MKNVFSYKDEEAGVTIDLNIRGNNDEENTWKPSTHYEYNITTSNNDIDSESAWLSDKASAIEEILRLVKVTLNSKVPLEIIEYPVRPLDSIIMELERFGTINKEDVPSLIKQIKELRALKEAT
jgi:hypothetical protein